MSVGVLLCYFGLRDTVHAGDLARTMERDNKAALAEALDTIEHDVESGPKGKPLILAQNPGIAWFEHQRNVRLMTPHLIDFPTSGAPLSTELQPLGVNYILLYAAHDGAIYSDDYRRLRPLADSMCTVIFRKTGTLFDVHRDYFAGKTLNDMPTNDTLILYKLPSIVR